MANDHAIGRTLIAGGMALALAGCQQGAVVDIVQNANTIMFNVKRKHSDKPACVGHIEVTSTASGPEKAIWESGNGGSGPCVGHFVFGRVAPGFTSSGPAPALVAGTSYHVDVYGIGFTGGADFTVGR